MNKLPLLSAFALAGSTLVTAGAHARVIVQSDAPGTPGGPIVGSSDGDVPTATVTPLVDAATGNRIGLLSTAGTTQFVSANSGTSALDPVFLGEDFTFSVDLLDVGSAATDDDFIYLQFFVDGVNFANSFNTSPQGNTTSVGALRSGGPVTLSFAATLPAAASTYQAQLIYVDGGFNGSPSAGGPVLTFDNFLVDAPNVAEVPEPASLALLGLGGVALLARRR